MKHPSALLLAIFGLLALVPAACAPQPATPSSNTTLPLTPVMAPTRVNTEMQALVTPNEASTGAPTQSAPIPTQVVTELLAPTALPRAASAADLARSDQQGAVEFVITPLNLSAAGATLDFDVSMNTHSVDLGWDLAAQSTLRTDTGLEVVGQTWPVGGGHHYAGTLSFPATTPDGQRLLEQAGTLTLTIRDTDVPERSFIWDLGQ